MILLVNLIGCVQNSKQASKTSERTKVVGKIPDLGKKNILFKFDSNILIIPYAELNSYLKNTDKSKTRNYALWEIYNYKINKRIFPNKSEHFQIEKKLNGRLATISHCFDKICFNANGEYLNFRDKNSKSESLLVLEIKDLKTNKIKKQYSFKDSNNTFYSILMLPENRVFIYFPAKQGGVILDLKTGKQFLTLKSNFPRSQTSLAYHNEKIYLIGGKNVSANSDDFKYQPSNSYEIYDIEANRYSENYRLKNNFINPKVLHLKSGKILLLGGNKVKKFLTGQISDSSIHSSDVIEIINPKTPNTAAFYHMIIPRIQPSIIEVENQKVLILGGERSVSYDDFDTEPVSEIEMIDLKGLI